MAVTIMVVAAVAEAAQGALWELVAVAHIDRDRDLFLSFQDMPIGKFGDFPDTQKTYLFLRLSLSVYEMDFQTVEYLRYLNSAGMNLNWSRIKLREKENQLSSRYDRGPLNSVIISRKHHNISERYDFGTRKHIEVGFNLSCGGTTNVMFLCFYVSLDLASVFFCWQDPDVRQTDI